MKMTEFRSRQPLSDDDFAAIRRNVMSTIAARKERRFLPMAMRFALAAVVIAIGVAVVLHRTAAPAGVAHTKPAPAIRTIPPPVAVAAVTIPPTVTPAAHRPRHHRAHPQSALAVASHQNNIRVEFRTSDPDVRIIWIASQTPNTTGGKS